MKPKTQIKIGRWTAIIAILFGGGVPLFHYICKLPTAPSSLWGLLLFVAIWGGFLIAISFRWLKISLLGFIAIIIVYGSACIIKPNADYGDFIAAFILCVLSAQGVIGIYRERIKQTIKDQTNKQVNESCNDYLAANPKEPPKDEQKQ